MTVTDSSNVDGPPNPETNTVSTTLSVLVTVTPVAEAIAGPATTTDRR